MEESMKMRLTAMIAASGMVAMAACAQKPAPTPAPTTPQTSTANASGMGEGRGGMRGGGQRMEQMLFNGITLSSTQQAQVDSIRAAHRSDMQGLDPRNNPDDRQKMMQSMQAQMSEIRAVLTADQQAIFDQNVQQMRDRRGQRGNGGGAPPRE
jgi:Spy/CpxP family protein refolding chaperone